MFRFLFYISSHETNECHKIGYVKQKWEELGLKTLLFMEILHKLKDEKIECLY